MADHQIILLEEHLASAAARITAGLVSTPKSRFQAVAAKKSLRGAIRRMKKLKFDQLPVKQGRLVVGLLRDSATADTPRQTIADAGFDPLSECGITQKASVPRLLDMLSERSSLLVTGTKNSVVGLIHYSDLNRQPMRVYLYLHLSALEMGLAELLRASGVPKDKWIELLAKRKRIRLKRKLMADRKEDVDIDPIESLEFSDLLRIAAGLPEIRAKCGFDSKSSFEKMANGLVPVRHAAMHPVRLVVRTHADVKRLVTKLRKTDELLGRIRKALYGTV